MPVFSDRDHSSGNEKIVDLLGKNLIVYGGDDRIPAITKKVTHGDEFKVCKPHDNKGHATANPCSDLTEKSHAH